MANETIRAEAKRAGLKLWEVAEMCGVTDSTFSKQLRRELPGDKQQHILSMIGKAAMQKAEARK